MFADLNQKWSGDLEDKERLIKSIALGYTCIAHNYTATTKQELLRECPVKDIDLDSMVQISELEKERSARWINGDPGIRQLKRITFSTGSSDEAQILMHTSRNPRLLSYDLVAFAPQSQEAMKMACESLDVDILSLDLALPFVFGFKQALLRKATQRGLHIEVCYCPSMFGSGNERQRFASFMNRYSIRTNAKATVLSSGCPSADCLRSPHDVINLATFFGFRPVQAKRALSTNCQMAINRAKIRRSKSQLSQFTVIPPSEDERDAKRPRTSG